MTRKRPVFLIAGIAVLGIGVAYWRLTLPPSPAKEGGDPIATPMPEPAAKAESEDDKARRRVVGVWQDEYEGKRTMSLNADGTGTMLVELGGLKALLFASKLRFDMEWRLEGKKLTKKTIGGAPADKVNLILNTMGNVAEDAILEIGDDRLLLLDKNGKTQYDWRRPKGDGGKREPESLKKQ